MGIISYPLTSVIKSKKKPNYLVESHELIANVRWRVENKDNIVILSKLTKDKKSLILPFYVQFASYRRLLIFEDNFKNE